jgi:hypothetical protein
MTSSFRSNSATAFAAALALILGGGQKSYSQTKPAAVKPATASAKPATPTGKPATAATKGNQGAVGPSVALPRVYAPTKLREVTPKYPWKEKITTTIFWIGEAPTENNPTPNHKSAWDVNWQANFGGYDDPNPNSRNWDFAPKGFKPKQNPFYVALPFNDCTNRDVAKQKIPWHKAKWDGSVYDSVCRSKWLVVRYGNKYCWAQWEDVGPWETNDHDYVFGNSRPKTVENDAAGLDVSPAVRDYLGISSGALCDWRFAEDSEVPDGPWRRYGTNNPFVRNESKEQEKLRAEYAELVKQRDEWLKQQVESKVRNR